MIPRPYFTRRRMGQRLPLQQLAETLRREGAVVTIQVAVPAAYAAELQQHGRPTPPPQVVKGLVDTGASISTVSEAVAQAAGLQTVGTVPLYGVGGGGEKPLFAASFGLPDYGVTIDPIEIGGVTIGMPGVDILIGRDILQALYLSYAGPEGSFGLLKNGGGAAVPGRPSEVPTETWIAVGGGLAAVAAIAVLAAIDVI